MDELGSEYANIKPSYERETTSSSLPRYANRDQDNIKNAFVPNSHQDIATLGGNMNSPTVLKEPNMLKYSKPQFFQSYEYISSEYDRAKLIKIQEHIEHEKKVQSISNGQPFLPSSSTVPEHIPHHIPDPFEALEDAQLRTKWIEEAKRIAGPFIAGGRHNVIEKPTRSMFNRLLEELYDQLEEDWPQALPTVFVERDLILIFFTTNDKSSSDSQDDRLSDGGWSDHEDSSDMNNFDSFDISAALLPYMNFFAQSNEIVKRYQLNRVIKRWNVPVGENKLLFTFRPPWVRMNEQYLQDDSKKKKKKNKKKGSKKKKKA
mmetsp:Transcript_3729/g.5513  ORF Transcript_3729/g.5513 Transcript_3729/m.5513 type:complete len:318 (+) Transcript_3729:25-978(+)